MADHPCPFTAGELLALGALADTAARTKGTNPQLAETCFEHALQHQITSSTETQEDR